MVLILVALLAQAALHLGSKFPELIVQTISARHLVIPAPTARRPQVVVFSFSRAAGDGARAWRERIVKDAVGVDVFSVIELESVPRLLRGFVGSQVRGSIPPAMHDTTSILYKDEAVWKSRLAVTDDDRPCVVLLDAAGTLRWITSSNFSEAEYSKVAALVRPSAQ